MPAKSKAQQKFMGMVHAAQKGEKAASAKVAKVAKRMKKKDAEDYASTKHKGLPTKVKKEALIRLISKYGAKKVKETIMAVSPKSDKGYREPEKPNFEYDPDGVDEGFGGELKGKDKDEFEKARKENAEVLGYEATGTSDTKKQTLKMAHQLKEVASIFEAKFTDDTLVTRLKHWSKQHKGTGIGYGHVLGHLAVHMKEMGWNKSYREVARIAVELGKKRKVESVNESGILYRAGVKKYGKEGMRKIQQAAGKRKSHAVIGAIKDKYEKDKEESVNEGGMGILDKDQTDVLHGIVMKNKSKNSKVILSIVIKDKMFKGVDKKELLGYIEGAKQFVKYMKSESVNEYDLGLTYKKGKTVKVKHKSSGKRLVIVDKPAVRKEYEKIGFYAESVNEELYNSQGEQTDFKKGDVVKDINPDCPHVGSEGKVTKVGNGTITFKVTNNGKTYQEGDELEKTVDQMVKIKESVTEGNKSKKVAYNIFGALRTSINQTKILRKMIDDAPYNKLYGTISGELYKFEIDLEKKLRMFQSPLKKLAQDKMLESVKEAAKRDYKDEYKKFQSSTKSKKYRAELNQYNRKKGTYGNNDGKDASHKGGKIAGFEKESTNRGRREKSRLKGEVSNPTSGIMMAGRMGVGNKYSSKEAQIHVDKDLGTMSKHLGKASQQVIKIMMDGVKGGKYDAMDLQRGFKYGPVKRTHFGEIDFIQQLWNKVREKFRKYSKRGKLK